MPKIGEVYKERKGGHQYVWLSCSICGREKWVVLPKKKAVTHKCSHHIGRPIDTNSTKKSTGYARAIRLYPSQLCEICGEKAEHHHKDGNSLNNNESNISFLCRKHHMEIDGRRKNTDKPVKEWRQTWKRKRGLLMTTG